MDVKTAYHIQVTGIVQGVGFRPFIYNLALSKNLTGWVKNTTGCVEIWIEGDKKILPIFTEMIKSNAPPLSIIDDIQFTEKKYNGYVNFEIISSVSDPTQFQSISPDLALCNDCLNELFNPEDRRYLYPFINCTNCGPRFSIIKDIPYDRINTTMAEFQMCPECLEEYEDPANRRFHAQPIACPNCGPIIWLNKSNLIQDSQHYIDYEGQIDVIKKTRDLIKEGKIIAVKGLGGFHLMCDATKNEPIALLRGRKKRYEKPFAVMMADIKTVSKYCQISKNEIDLLESPAHPIVILKVINPNVPVNLISPGQNSLGVMLPYTPLHALLMQKEDGFPDYLIMTSGNLTDEPICIDNEDAINKLGTAADAFLLHNRKIHIRNDDSVYRIFNNDAIPVRRSRGYAPLPIKLIGKFPSILSCGAEQKNTFCLTKENFAFLSHHIGDLDNYENLLSYENGITHFENIFRIKPELIAYDLHPDYLSTRYAMNRSQSDNLQSIGVQHHHAHIASLMIEKSIPADQPVIGSAFDGTGYGIDGTIWGGEFLCCSYKEFTRMAHLETFALPGGDASIKKPSRVAFSLLHTIGVDIDELIVKNLGFAEHEKNMLYNQLTKQINTPMTSSMGRLFDAVSALCGIKKIVSYEGQAAIELEAHQDPEETGYYEFGISKTLISWESVINSILKDLAGNISVNTISSKFHNGIALMVSNMCKNIRSDTGLNIVALSGGVWQNITLLEKTKILLETNQFDVLYHTKFPTNDGGIALGQAAIASVQIK
ncbi:MAG: carbamoyltransferase HypF [Chloroflexota bacterium]